MRLFTLMRHAIWLLASLDPADGDTAFGVMDVGIRYAELGRIHGVIWPLSSDRVSNPVMRDRYFQAVRPLSEYLRLAQGKRLHLRRLNRSRHGQAGRIETISVLLRPAKSESALLHRNGALMRKTATIFCGSCGTVLPCRMTFGVERPSHSDGFRSTPGPSVLTP